jgi:hypothetical protein
MCLQFPNNCDSQRKVMYCSLFLIDLTCYVTALLSSELRFGPVSVPHSEISHSERARETITDQDKAKKTRSDTRVLFWGGLLTYPPSNLVSSKCQRPKFKAIRSRSMWPWDFGGQVLQDYKTGNTSTYWHF